MKTITPQEETKLLTTINPNYYRILTEQQESQHSTLTVKAIRQTRNLVATLVMLDAGLRVGEVVGLIWTDVYFDVNPMQNIIVPATISKSKTERQVPITKRLRTILQYYGNILRDPTENLRICHLIRPPVVQNPLTPRAIQRFITIASMDALGYPIHPHTLRHTYATKMMKLTDLRTVQELLGHKNVSSTQVYTHVNDEDKRRAVQALDDHLSGDSSLALFRKRTGELHDDFRTSATNR